MKVDNLTYIINLQRAVEYHCMGLLVPDDVMSECPHHAEMLNLQLSRQQQQESRPTPRAADASQRDEDESNCNNVVRDGVEPFMRR